MRRFTTDPTPVLCRLAAAALLALTAIIPVFAESSSDTGTIVGTVTDSLRGLPMPDASVIVLGHRRGAMTDTAGMFRIRNVPVGIQTVRVLSIGNDPALRTVTVRANEETRVSFAILRAWLGDSEADDVPIPPALRDVRVRCTIRPTKQVFRVGERPTFDVRIVNDGRDTVLLVRSLDGSERGRSPQVNLEVAGPGFEKPALIYCGNQNSLELADFDPVPPGASFDPYDQGFGPVVSHHGSLREPGRHVATFRYATDERRISQWAGDRRTWSVEFEERMRRVPSVVLEATTEFEVRR